MPWGAVRDNVSPEIRDQGIVPSAVDHERVPTIGRREGKNNTVGNMRYFKDEDGHGWRGGFDKRRERSRKSEQDDGKISEEEPSYVLAICARQTAQTKTISLCTATLLSFLDAPMKQFVALFKSG